MQSILNHVIHGWYGVYVFFLYMCVLIWIVGGCYMAKMDDIWLTFLNMD